MSFDLLLPKDIERFHAKYDRPASGCWEWRGERQGFGYGVLSIWRDNKRAARYYTHRVAAYLDGQEVDGLVVRHRCDNPPCVNPEHLLTGTQRDNIRDAYERGRLNMSGLALAPTRTDIFPTSCTSADCGRPVIAKGLCSMHYQRSKRLTPHQRRTS